MARALWKGLVNFGLVNIPIELHVAVRDHMPRFRLLHRKDLSPIRQERVCQLDGHAVAWEDLVKGYEVAKGEFVTVTEDDFKTAALERSRSIDIMEFVPVDDIDARYWDTPYLVLPGKGGEHSYGLLARTLEDSGRAGIAKYVMRQRQHLAALRAVDGALLLTTLKFHEDLVDLPKVTSGKPSAKELSLAGQLVNGMADSWDPTRYRDDYVPALMKVIDAKAHGVTTKAPSRPAAKSTNVVDLVERLRQSLAAAKGGKAPAPAREARASAPKARPRTAAAKAKSRRPARARKAASKRRAA
jgi:DNA end-binding protein Ku